MSRTVQSQRGVGGTVSSSTIDGILKEDYVINNIKDTVNMSTYFLSRIRARKSTGGRQFRFPVRFEVSEGQGFRSELETLPEPGYGAYQQAKGNFTHQYGRIRITGQAIHATNRAAFTQSLGSAITNCRDGFKLVTYRGTWGKRDGIIAEVKAIVTVGAAGDIDDVTTQNPYGLTYDAAISKATMHPYFRKGMRVSFGTYASGVWTSKNTGEITGILSNGTLKVKFKKDTNLAVGDKIVRADAVGTKVVGDFNKSYRGVLETVQDSGEYLGITRTEEPGWQSNEIDANANTLSEDLLQEGFDASEIEGNGMMDPNLLISNHATRRIYQNLRYSQKRIVNNLNLKGGHNAIEFNGKPWVRDKLCPPEHLFYLNTEDWCWFYNADVQWIDNDGSILDREENVHAFKGALYAFRDLACLLPANQTAIEGLDT